jgi:hypothetical protein
VLVAEGKRSATRLDTSSRAELPPVGSTAVDGPEPRLEHFFDVPSPRRSRRRLQRDVG